MGKNKWKIWFEVFNQNGKKIGAGVYYYEYKFKRNACRAAKRMYGKHPDKYRYIVSIDNPFVNDKKPSGYELAVCDIEFRNTTFAVAVKKEDKERAEVEMALAYECWSNEDEETCIIPNYDTDAIGQACYGDFIIDWLKEKGIFCDNTIDLIPLDTYCHDEPPEDYDGNKYDWMDMHVTTYWFKKPLLETFLKTIGTTIDMYLHSYTYDDVVCDVLTEVPFTLKFTYMN